MIEVILVFVIGLVLGNAIQFIANRYALRAFWRELTDYYYMEHIYPLLKTDRLRAIQRELAWRAFSEKYNLSTEKPLD